MDEKSCVSCDADNLLVLNVSLALITGDNLFLLNLITLMIYVTHYSKIKIKKYSLTLDELRRFRHFIMTMIITVIIINRSSYNGQCFDGIESVLLRSSDKGKGKKKRSEES